MKKPSVTHLRPSRAYHSLLSRFMAFIASLFSNITVEGLENVPKRGGAVIAANHFSYFDAVALTAALDRSGRDAMVLAKAELFNKPLLRFLLPRVGAIPVYRGGSRAVESLSSAVESLKHGELVAVFPEGTIPKNGRLMEFKTGAVRMSLQAGVPIVPVAMVGTNDVIPSAMKRIKRTMWKRSLFRADIHIRVMEPLRYEGDAEDREAVQARSGELHDAMKHQLLAMGYTESDPIPFIRKRNLALTLAFSMPVVGWAIERVYSRTHGRKS